MGEIEGMETPKEVFEKLDRENRDKKTKEILNMQAVEEFCQAAGKAVIGRIVAPATQSINLRIQKLLFKKLKDGYIDLSEIKLSEIEEIVVEELKATWEKL